MMHASGLRKQRRLAYTRALDTGMCVLMARTSARNAKLIAAQSRAWGRVGLFGSSIDSESKLLKETANLIMTL